MASRSLMSRIMNRKLRIKTPSRKGPYARYDYVIVRPKSGHVVAVIVGHKLYDRQGNLFMRDC